MRMHLQVTKPEDNTAICDITLQGSASECCTAVLQILHHASAAYSQNSDLSSGMFAQPAWQFTHQVSKTIFSWHQHHHHMHILLEFCNFTQGPECTWFSPIVFHLCLCLLGCCKQDQQEVLSTNQLTQLPLDAFAPDAPCLHLPSSCFLTLPLAVQCCQLLTLGLFTSSPDTVYGLCCLITCTESLLTRYALWLTVPELGTLFTTTLVVLTGACCNVCAVLPVTVYVSVFSMRQYIALHGFL